MGTYFDNSYSEKQIGAWNRSCLWPFVGHQEKVTNLESRERSLYSFKTVHNYFWNSLRQTSKSTWKEADIWCNFTDSSSNRERYIHFFSCYRCWLGNYLNERTFVILVIGLPVQLNAIAKKLSWKTTVLPEFSEGRMDSCYCATTLGTPWTHVKQGWYGNPSWIHQKWFWNYLRQTSKFTWKDVEQLMWLYCPFQQ